MTPRIKICGLTRPEDVAVAIENGADFLGFIVEAKSARRLTVAQAARLALPAKDIVPTVAVTVNASDALLEAICAQMQPDYIQLHGDETPERVAAIKTQFDVGFIKALPIAARQDLALIPHYDVDLTLLDAKPPKGAARGGHGTAFDWNILRGAVLPETWMLAGGINPETASRAAAFTQAPILDVSSGVESAPGIKDLAKLKALFKAVNSV